MDVMRGLLGSQCQTAPSSLLSAGPATSNLTRVGGLANSQDGHIAEQLIKIRTPSCRVATLAGLEGIDDSEERSVLLPSKWHLWQGALVLVRVVVCFVGLAQVVGHCTCLDV